MDFKLLICKLPLSPAPPLPPPCFYSFFQLHVPDSCKSKVRISRCFHSTVIIGCIGIIRLRCEKAKHVPSYCKQGELMIVRLCWRSGRALLIQLMQFDSMPLTKIVLVFISKTNCFTIVKRISEIT